ncbi:MAG: sugar transferase [Planctomycetes bacterium]|nr:sugar transferase [Planctomycetota bacterium]
MRNNACKEKAIYFESEKVSKNTHSLEKIKANTCSSDSSQKTTRGTFVNTKAVQSLELFFHENTPIWKRIIDLFGSALCIIISLPIMLFVACAIKSTSKGPVFFSQKRCGLGGKPFNVYKFRSMVVDAEKRKKELEENNIRTGPVFKMKDDPRVTFIGRIIRKWSLDESPQFFNVLIGDMSLVGPRPPTLCEVPKYERWHKRRLEVKPGITGIWQVYARQNKCFKEWVRMDIEYINKRSLFLDMKILLKTIPAVISCKGAC